MIHFERLDLSRKEAYERYLKHSTHRGCGYSFANLEMWGRQRVAILEGYLVIFSQFDRRSVYPFPAGQGDIRPVLEAIVADAKARGIPCCFCSMTAQDCQTLEAVFPGKFQCHADRDSFDYIYDIQDLAELKGRKYQKKRNHLNRFRQEHPDHRFEPLTGADLPQVRQMVQTWFDHRLREDPHQDFHLERRALERAFGAMEALELEGLLLREGDEILAMTLGSRLDEQTFDVHFEKARLDVDGAYPAINNAFAKYLRDKYPQIRWLDREDDMGLEGLRKAKLSYFPERLVEKYWARLWEEEDEV